MTFVISREARVKGFGVGKLVDPEKSPGLIQYFVSPAEDLRRLVGTDVTAAPGEPTEQQSLDFAA